MVGRPPRNDAGVGRLPRHFTGRINECGSDEVRGWEVKLLKFKEWVTLEEAVRHLSQMFEDEVYESDVLRLALDGHLTLSVNFVNGSQARRARVIPVHQALMNVYTREPLEGPSLGLKAMGVTLDDIDQLPEEIQAGLKDGTLVLTPRGDTLNEDEVIQYDEKINSIWGVHDIPMIGAERLDIEHAYQGMTGGPELTAVNLTGAFVGSIRGELYQLQESFDSNEYQKGSQASLENIKDLIKTRKLGDKEAKKLLDEHREDRKQFLQKVDSQPRENNYYPAGGLPQDAPIVVRTAALRDLIERAADTDTSTAPSGHYVSDNLTLLNLAARQFWSNADPEDAGTHPREADVVEWLTKRNLSQRLAKAAASIIRPSWAAKGRRPD